LAHHALRGEMWEKAVTYLRQAALRAMVQGANREAVAHLKAARYTFLCVRCALALAQLSLRAAGIR